MFEHLKDDFRSALGEKELLAHFGSYNYGLV